MNEEDEITSVRRLRSNHTSPESCLSNDCERLPPKARSPKHGMSDDEGRFGLRLVEELYETAYPQRIRKKIRPGNVWQAAYDALLTDPEGLAASLQSSNHSEHVVVSSSPMKPYSH
jgi:hypothetical protein